jgi:hypothetical protein
MSGTGFELWLEFEHWQREEGDDPEDDFFNMHIRLENGETYALNVWTFKFFERANNPNDPDYSLEGKYMLAPDLFVERLDRELITEVIRDLIKKRMLKKEWLVSEE